MVALLAGYEFNVQYEKSNKFTLVKNGQKSPTRIAEMQELFIKEYNEMEFGMDIV